MPLMRRLCGKIRRKWHANEIASLEADLRGIKDFRDNRRFTKTREGMHVQVMYEMHLKRGRGSGSQYLDELEQKTRERMAKINRD